MPTAKSLRSIRHGIEDRGGTRDQIADEMARAGADTETVAGKPRGQDEPWDARRFADAGHAVWRAVDKSSPGIGNPRWAKRWQQVDSPAVYLSLRCRIGPRAEGRGLSCAQTGHSTVKQNPVIPDLNYCIHVNLDLLQLSPREQPRGKWCIPPLPLQRPAAGRWTCSDRS